MMSFLHNDVIVVITFYILIFSMISTIFNLIIKALYIELEFWGLLMHNTTCSPLDEVYFK